MTVSAETRAAAHLHDQLMAWLKETAPYQRPHVVLAALSYEIARIVASAPVAPDGEDAMLEGVVDVMRLQINAYRAGKLPPWM